MKDPRAQELLRRLLVELDVDVFATNQLPRNYASLGIDYETLRAAKPDLIWLGITGFGPDSNDAAYDPILQARGGLMDLTGEPDGDPQVVGIPLPDMGTSEHAYGQVMKALYRRAVTGEGARIDLAMIDSTVSWLAQPVTMAKTFGKKMRRRGSTHEFFGPVNVFPTADGYVYLALGNDKQWQRLIALPGFEGLAEPGVRHERRPHRRRGAAERPPGRRHPRLRRPRTSSRPSPPPPWRWARCRTSTRSAPTRWCGRSSCAASTRRPASRSPWPRRR